MVGASIDLAKLGDFWNQHPLFQATFGAFMVGVVGSSAYLTALFLGFLGVGPFSMVVVTDQQGRPTAALDREDLANRIKSRFLTAS